MDILELTLHLLQAFCDTDGVREDGGCVVVGISRGDRVKLVCKGKTSALSITWGPFGSDPAPPRRSR